MNREALAVLVMAAGCGDIAPPERQEVRGLPAPVAKQSAPDWGEDEDGGVGQAPVLLTPGLTPYEGQRVYVERQDSSGHLLRDYMIWHALTSGGGGWQHTHEVHHVYHSSPTPTNSSGFVRRSVSAPVSKPTYRPASSSTSAIKTTRSSAVRMSPSSFRSSSRSFGGGRR